MTQLLLNAEVGEDLGLGFVHGQQVVAGGAILRDGLAVLCCVLAIVAAEAAGIAHVADVIGVRSPGDFHFGKHVGREDVTSPSPAAFTRCGLRGQHIRVFAAIELQSAAPESSRAPRPR